MRALVHIYPILWIRGKLGIRAHLRKLYIFWQIKLQESLEFVAIIVIDSFNWACKHSSQIYVEYHDWPSAMHSALTHSSHMRGTESIKFIVFPNSSHIWQWSAFGSPIVRVEAYFFLFLLFLLPLQFYSEIISVQL